MKNALPLPEFLGPLRDLAVIESIVVKTREIQQGLDALAGADQGNLSAYAKQWADALREVRKPIVATRDQARRAVRTLRNAG